MTVETFFEKFELFADAPDAIEKMRELTLRLAVQGKLVPQNKAETSAFSLLVDIETHKESLAKAGKCRGSTAVNAIEGSGRFDSPNGWAWVRFGDLMINRDGERVPVSKEERSSRAKKFDYYGASGVIDKIDDFLFDKPLLLIGEDGANLINRSTPIAFIARGKYWVNNHAHVLDGISEDVLRYVALYINAIDLKPFVTGSAQPKMNQAKMNSIPIAVPPLAEQKRIVAKVDELMALCDRLEAQQKEREAKHAHLARAALVRFAEAPTPANLDYLFHHAYTIDPADLRKSILTMAVQGKLLTQNRNDEPAAELVAKAITNLPAEKRKRVPKPLPPVDDPPFAIPSAWTWARFQEIAFIASNLVDPKPHGDRLHLAPDNIEKGTGILLPCRTVHEDEVKSGNHLFYAGQLVYSKIRPNLSKVVWVDFDGLCSADMYPIDPLVDPRYLLRCMLSEEFLQQAVKTDTRVAMPKINQNELNAILVPVPPLAEQRRIVAKVDALMALVDRLEAELAESRAVAGRLMEAVVAELTRSADDRVDVKAIEPREANEARLACYVLKRWGGIQPGRVKLEKAFDFSQTHCGAALGREASWKQHGPVDYALLRAAEAWAGEQGGFATDDPGNNGKVLYTPDARFDDLAAEGEALLGDRKAEVDRVLDLLAPLSTSKCGDLATVYNAWASLIAKGDPFNDRDIIRVCRHEWHAVKETIPDSRWFSAIRFLQSHRLTPMDKPA